MSKFNDAWEHIFSELDILNHVAKTKFFDITATQIKEITGLEPRLMSKIDTRAQLPPILKENKLSLLATENGTYRIAKTDPFIDIPKEIEGLTATEKNFPSHIETLKPEQVRSESSALDIALVSNMTESYLNESVYLTQRGRLRGNANFIIEQVPYSVNGVQIEIDAGYESLNAFHIFEAKIGMQDSLSYRQLIYPLKAWENTISKPCHSHVFIYDKNRYYFIPITSKINEKPYINIDDVKVFTIHPSIKTIHLSQIPINDSKIKPAPFPQADDLNKVIYLLNEVALNPESGSTVDEIFLNNTALSVLGLGCDRQYDYYFNALKWLGLATKKGETIKATSEGLRVASYGLHRQFIEVANIVSTNNVFRYFLMGRSENDPSIIKYMKQHNIDSQSTISRRIKTVSSWVDTLKNYVEFY
jgi:hypothetical protein